MDYLLPAAAIIPVNCRKEDTNYGDRKEEEVAVAEVPHTAAFISSLGLGHSFPRTPPPPATQWTSY